MRRYIVLASLVAAVVVGLWPSRPVVAADTPTSMPAITIPLDLICATSKQEGLHKVGLPDMKLGEKSPAILGFAWAKNFDALAKGTLTPPVGTKDKPLNISLPNDPGDMLWAAVYFGRSGSLPPQWIIDSVTRNDGAFELAYHPAKPGVMTDDLFPYVAWIPLGKLPIGEYKLTLVESGKQTAQASWGVTPLQGGAKVGVVQPKRIAMDCIYSTTEQEGVNLAPQKAPTFGWRASQAPAVLGMAWAKDFESLGDATVISAAKGAGTFSIKRPIEPVSTLWAIVYLGSPGKAPSHWVIDSVSTKDGAFDLAYHSEAATKDAPHGVVWIPLGDLPTGAYTLMLLESGTPTGDVTWTVAGQGGPPQRSVGAAPAPEAKASDFIRMAK